MGSTLETTISFSLVLIILTSFIVLPINIWKSTTNQASKVLEELSFHLENDYPTSTRYIDEYYSSDTCPERLNTMISSLFDSISIIRGK